MKARMLTFFIMFIVFPVVVSAAPWLVCDPQKGVTHYEVTFNNGEPEEVVAQADGSLKYDVANVPVGGNTVSAKAIIKSDTWGSLESEPSPFQFTRPKAAEKPGGFGLTLN